MVLTVDCIVSQVKHKCSIKEVIDICNGSDPSASGAPKRSHDCNQQEHEDQATDHWPEGGFTNGSFSGEQVFCHEPIEKATK